MHCDVVKVIMHSLYRQADRDTQTGREVDIVCDQTMGSFKRRLDKFMDEDDR